MSNRIGPHVDVHIDDVEQREDHNEPSEIGHDTPPPISQDRFQRATSRRPPPPRLDLRTTDPVYFGLQLQQHVDSKLSSLERDNLHGHDGTTKRMTILSELVREQGITNESQLRAIETNATQAWQGRKKGGLMNRISDLIGWSQRSKDYSALLDQIAEQRMASGFSGLGAPGQRLSKRRQEELQYMPKPRDRDDD
jgi:hypothetical protein